MRTMSTEEWRAFLLSPPVPGGAALARTAKLATVRADGGPHVAPIWFDLDTDGTVVFMTGRDTVKGRAIRRDGRVALCVDDETPPFTQVVLEGTVTVSEDLDEMLPWSIRIAGRYMGTDQAEAFGRRNAVPGELLVRLAPTKVRALSGLSE